MCCSFVQHQPLKIYPNEKNRGSLVRESSGHALIKKPNKNGIVYILDEMDTLNGGEHWIRWNFFLFSVFRCSKFTFAVYSWWRSRMEHDRGYWSITILFTVPHYDWFISRIIIKMIHFCYYPKLSTAHFFKRKNWEAITRKEFLLCPPKVCLIYLRVWLTFCILYKFDADWKNSIRLPVLQPWLSQHAYCWCFMHVLRLWTSTFRVKIFLNVPFK